MTLDEATRKLTESDAEFEIAVEDVAGVPTRVWRYAPRNLRDVLEASRAHDDRTFLVYEDERITFRQHYGLVARLAAALVHDLGVEKGDRVAIAMRNYPEWVIAFWATVSVGGVVVPLNAWWSRDELAYGVADSGARVVFADEQRAAVLAEPCALQAAHMVIVRCSDNRPAGALDLSALMSRDHAELPSVEVATDDDATIFYTSGTTGRPKGAIGTHRNMCSNLHSLRFIAASGRARFARAGVAEPRGPSQNCYLLSVPLFHANGCHSVLVPNTMAGGKLVMMHRWDAPRALELIEREEVTMFGGVPTMVAEVLDCPDLLTRDISSVKNVTYGGAPAPPELVRRIGAHFPTGRASNGYGLTETSAVATMISGADYVAKPDSVGAPVPVVEVKVLLPDGTEAATGERGELFVKGPNVVRGYWGRPEETAAAFCDGWFATGDIAYLDDDGFVFIVDRAKDMLIRGGENIYCVEVENAIGDHPSVAEVAVIGVPHPNLGEEVGAVVRTRTSDFTVSELQLYVAERLAGFKVPAHVWFVDEPLPRNATGKVLKGELRDRHAPRGA